MLSLLLKNKLIYSTILTYAAIFTLSHYSDTISSSIAHKFPGLTATANVSNSISSGVPDSNSLQAQIPQVPEPVVQVAQATPVENDKEPEPPKVIQQTIVKTITEQPTIIVQGTTQEYVDARYTDLSAQIKSAVSQIAQQNSNTLAATVGNMAQVFSRPATNLSNTVVTNGTLSGAFSGAITNSSFSGSSIVAETGNFSDNVSLASISSPAVTSNKLYNVGGALYWNGSAVSTGLSPWVQGTGMVRPANTTDQVLIGASATTTTAALEINGNLAIRENNSLQIGAYRALTVDDSDSSVLIGRFSTFTPTGSSQIGIGRNTLNRSNGAYQNVAIGDYALSTTTGGESVAIGYEAGRRLANAYSNVTIGSQAMTNPNGGDYNVAVGYRALMGQQNYSFSRNTAVGNETLVNMLNGASNTVLGAFAGYYIDSGSNNTLIGESAGYRVFGSNNIMLGYRAGYNGLSSYTGSNNILIGNSIYTPSDSSSNYLSIGNLIYGNGVNGSGGTISTGAIGIGTSSPYARLSVTGHSASTTPIFAVASSTNTPLFTINYDGRIGVGTTSPASAFAITGTTTISGGLNIVTANSNRQKGYITFNGANLITTDQYNWGLSIGRGDYGGTPENNGHIAIGIGTLKSANSGYTGIAIGNLAGEDAYLGYSIAIGDGSLRYSANSSSDIAIGRDALRSAFTSSLENVAVGEGALAGNNGYAVRNNAVIGYRAMNQNTDGSFNAVIGSYALDAGRGDYNVAMGYEAGRSYIAPDDSIFIGKRAGGLAFAANTGTNNIFIGREVAPLSTTQNNFMTIANLIYGTDITGTGTTLSIGNVGIGTSSPRYRLHVASSTNNEVARFEGVPGQQCTVTAGTGIACTSDERFKTNILEIASTTLSKVLSLKPVTFNWKANPDGSPQVGFIAQDIEKLYPELVATDKEGNKSVFYSQFVALLTKAIQVIEARLTALEKKVDTLLANAGNTAVINQNAGQYITSKAITTEELRVQPANALASGITITDRGTGNLLCAYFEYGALKTTSGACMAPETPAPSEPMASSTPATPPESPIEPPAEPIASTTQALPPRP